MKGALEPMHISWVRFSLGVFFTSVALVIALFALGGFVAGSALAFGPRMAFDHAAGPNRGDFKLPPELASLKDVPADQRFSHFKGVTASLTDKDGKPIQITVTPGVATAVSASSVTLNGNDGAQHTYAVDGDTFTRGTPANGQNVVVVTLNNANTARALVAMNGDWHRGN